jgi:hypothetical protein
MTGHPLSSAVVIKYGVPRIQQNSELQNSELRIKRLRALILGL